MNYYSIKLILTITQFVVACDVSARWVQQKWTFVVVFRTSDLFNEYKRLSATLVKSLMLVRHNTVVWCRTATCVNCLREKNANCGNSLGGLTIVVIWVSLVVFLVCFGKIYFIADNMRGFQCLSDFNFRSF